MEFNYIIANRTDIGASRQANEDCMTTFDSPNGHVVVVCDGMGGQAAGDLASRLACDIIRDILQNNVFVSPNEAITRAVMAANQGILHRAAQDPDLEGMGSTCVMAIIKDGAVYYGWVGDSRIYYIASDGITQISRDQSYVQQLVDTGQITREEAAVHPQKNEITNALGVMGMTPPELGAVPLRPEAGSVMLLCSDGLTGMVSDAEIRSVVVDKNLTLQQRADRLVDLANAHGGLDNITLQMIEFSDAAADAKVGNGVKARQKSMIMTVGCVAVVLIAGFVAFALLRNDGKKPSKNPEPKPKTEVVDKRTVKKAPAATPAPQKPEPVTTVTVKQEKPKGKSGKNKNDNDKTGEKVDGAGAAADALGNNGGSTQGDAGGLGTLTKEIQDK